MTGKTHAVCGAVTMLAIVSLKASGIEIGENVYMPAVGLFTVVAGSYAPDIDIPQSTLGKKFKLISKHLTHRGFTHTLIVPLLLFFLMSYTAGSGIPIIPELLLGFEVGYVAHIIADAFNKKGVPLFWPLTSSHIHIASVLTGSWEEKVFLLLWIGGHVAWVLFQL